ncbi:MAG: hypothetical protein WC976_06575 [Caldisericia bacterium]
MQIKEIKKILKKEYELLNDKVIFGKHTDTKLNAKMVNDGKIKEVYFALRKNTDSNDSYELLHVWYY